MRLVRFVNMETVMAAMARARLFPLRIGLVNTIMEDSTMTSEMPIKNLLEIMMLFRENTGLKLETTLYDDFAVLSNNKFKIIVMGREKRAGND
jgi:hypothetical protein